MELRPKSALFSLCLATSLFVITTLARAEITNELPLWKNHSQLTPSSRRHISERFLKSDGRWDLTALQTFHQEIRARHEQLEGLSKNVASSPTLRVHRWLEAELARLIDTVSQGQPVARDQEIAAVLRILELDLALKSRAAPGPFMRSMKNRAASNAVWSLYRGIHHPIEAENLPEGINDRELRDAVDQSSKLDPSTDSPFWRRNELHKIQDVADYYYRVGSPLQRGLTHEFPESTDSQSTPAVQLQKIIGTAHGTGASAPQLLVGFQNPENETTSRARIRFRSRVHSDPSASALASLLGYSTPVFKHYRNLKVYLGATTLRQFKIQFLEQLNPSDFSTSLDFEPNVSGTGTDERGDYILFREVLVESMPREQIELGPWDAGSLGHDRLREVRGFEIFQLWLGNIEAGARENTRVIIKQTPDGLEFHQIYRDLGSTLGGILPETPSALPWGLIRTSSDQIIEFAQKSVAPNPLRGSLTEADARWAARLIGALTRSQIEQSIRLGAWPHAVERLLVEKLCHRRNELIRAFGLSEELGLLPADRELTTPDGAVVKGELKQTRFADSVLEYGLEDLRLREANAAALKLSAARLIQMGTHGMGFTRLAEFSMGSNVGLINEGMIKIDREIEQNPNPKDESERYLVQDLIKVGYKLGAGFILSGQLTVWQQYKLVYPVRTEAQALAAGSLPVNLLMPIQLWKGDLPDRFVLMTETAIEGAGRIDLGIPGVLPFSVDATRGALTLARTAMERTQEGNFKIFRDREISTRSQFRFLAEALGIIRTPIVQSEHHDEGEFEGRVWTIPGERFFESPELAHAVLQIVRFGDADNLDEMSSSVVGEIKPQILQGTFSTSKQSWNLLGLWSGEKRFEFLRAWGLPVGLREQYRVSNDRHWSLLDWREDHSVHADLTFQLPEELLGPLPDWERVLRIRWKIDDRDTSTDEIQNGYIELLNRLAGEKAIPIDMKLFSQDQKWGRTLTHIELEYGPEAIRKLKTLTPELYWRSLGEVLKISDEQIEALREKRDLVLTQRRGRRTLPTPITPEARAVSESKDFVSKFWGWSGSKIWDWDRFMKVLNNSFRDGSLTQRSWIIQTLNQFVGQQNLRISGRIAPPYGGEELFPGAKPLEYRREPLGHAWANASERLEPLMLFADTPTELYRFFDAFLSASSIRR